MKILFHHRTLGDGAEGIHVSAIVGALRQLGHDVRVAALIGEPTNVESTRTRALSLLKQVMPRAVFELLELAYSVVGRRMLLGHVASFRPDALYERYTLFNCAGVLAARHVGIPMILEMNAPLAYERATYESLTLRGLARRLERYVCMRADVVIVVSTTLREHLIKEGVPAERIVVLPNGADPSVFRPDERSRTEIRRRFGLAATDVVVGFSGILRPWHGVDMLIRSIARLRERDDVKAMIVGDGPSLDSLAALARDLGVERRIVFTGRVSHAEIPAYVAAFDVGVSPRATFYASPMKVPEYMAAGVAVIAPRTRNLEDLVVDGVDGVLFEADNEDDLSRALSSLVHDVRRRERLGRAARATITSRRTWRHNAQRVVDLIDRERRACA